MKRIIYKVISIALKLAERGLATLYFNRCVRDLEVSPLPIPREDKVTKVISYLFNKIVNMSLSHVYRVKELED